MLVSKGKYNEIMTVLEDLIPGEQYVLSNEYIKIGFALLEYFDNQLFLITELGSNETEILSNEEYTPEAYLYFIVNFVGRYMSSEGHKLNLDDLELKEWEE